MMMNFNHKCHFHPNNAISKFCPLQACTLPLCQICETIHLQEHKNNFQEVKLIRFNQAYLNAINRIENYLEQQRRIEREMQRQIESDKEAVLRFIGNYYNEAMKNLEEVKNKMNPLEEKLAKLKKGSIKTLIFYYSGDIKLEKQAIEFQTLIEKLNAQRPAAYLPKHTEDQLAKIYVQQIQQPLRTYITQSTQNKQTQIRQNSSTKILRQNNDQTNKPSKMGLDENVFQRIEQPKMNERQRQKSRKSIFDNAKKSTIVDVDTRQRVNKYSYNIQHKEDGDVVKISPSFKNATKNTVENNQLINREISQKIEKQDEPLIAQLRMSYQNQITNKFTGSEQYQAYKKQREQKLFQQISYHQNKILDQKHVFEYKILKTSDLDVEKTNTLNNCIVERSLETKENIGQRNFVDMGAVRTERLRSMSQANIVNRQGREAIPKETAVYDLKKQVLSPQQIRKMLQKRIEQRNNKIMCLKKNDMGGVQTKNSLINQIYEPKY